MDKSNGFGNQRTHCSRVDYESHLNNIIFISYLTERHCFSITRTEHKCCIIRKSYKMHAYIQCRHKAEFLHDKVIGFPEIVVVFLSYFSQIPR